MPKQTKMEVICMYPITPLFPANEVDIEQDDNEYRIVIDVNVGKKAPVELMIYPVIED